MNDRIMRDVEILTKLFEAGGWTELRVESSTISLLLSSDGTAITLAEARMGSVAKAVSRTPQAKPSQNPAPAAAPAASVDPHWHVISAPTLGTFYRAPKPGAAPFVELGQKVSADTEVCLIEVMKLFTSVQAGVTGTVRHIAAADAELVAGGQALIYVERD